MSAPAGSASPEAPPSILDRHARALLWTTLLVYAGVSLALSQVDQRGALLWVGVGLMWAVQLTAAIGIVQREKRLGDPSPWAWIVIVGVLGVFGVLWWFRHDERRATVTYQRNA